MRVTAEQKTDFNLQPVRFIVDDTHTTFKAEFAMVDGAIVYHFFLTPEMSTRARYWEELFPNALSRVAERYFNATYPRLKAAYTEEVKSWWMRAEGFGLVLDPHKFSYRFFELLDTELEEVLKTTA
jgi:hypothetical protein